MSRKTIQPDKKFLKAIELVQAALKNQRLWVRFFSSKPFQSGPSPTPPRNVLSFIDSKSPVEGIANDTDLKAFLVLENDQLADTFSTEKLKESLEEQIANKSGEEVSGVKASELRAVALESQALNGLRRRGATRQLNRLDRIARAAARRELLASKDGPLQSVLVKRVEDTLARVNSST